MVHYIRNPGLSIHLLPCLSDYPACPVSSQASSIHISLSQALSVCSSNYIFYHATIQIVSVIAACVEFFCFSSQIHSLAMELSRAPLLGQHNEQLANGSHYECFDIDLCIFKELYMIKYASCVCAIFLACTCVRKNAEC